MAILTIQDIHKAYDDTPVLRGVNLEVQAGGVTALLGPSGCGKTTLLRLVAGLEQADRGSISFEGKSLAGVPPHERGFGLMFQEYALFPHLDVAANVAFGLRARKWDRRTIIERVGNMLDLVGMRAYGRRRVYDLSGGERQRVALARALAPGPRLLMLDEPLAALDRELRERLQDELRAILRQVQITALYVTHDQLEAFALADQVVLLRAGLIVQTGAPTVLYRRPADLWAARFLGMRNTVAGVYRGAGMVETGLGMLRGTVVQEPPIDTAAQVVIAPDAGVTGANINRVVVGLENPLFLGRLTRYRARHANGISLDLELEAPAEQLGATAEIALQPERVLIYAAAESSR
ncbi:MAG: ABC transporter ATP-binding protein [Oscillochloris sp.]|nr:ABC transporter ATP-binding protein [Oscillochloris sp.]